MTCVFVFCPSRNVMSDFGGEVLAEVLAQRALVKPQIIPLLPLPNQYRHPDHMDHKDYKIKVRPGGSLAKENKVNLVQWFSNQAQVLHYDDRHGQTLLLT